jgi:predicted RNase H-like HicB family nuclease
MTEFAVIIEHDPDNGSYGASNPDLPVDGIGKTPDEAVARFQNALNDYLAFLRERGQPISRAAPHGDHGSGGRRERALVPDRSA